MKNKIVHTLLIIVIIIGLLEVGWIVNFNKVIEGDLLAYSGAVIGGGLTLLGVIMTINYQDSIRKEELAIQYKPILTLKGYYPKLDEAPTGCKCTDISFNYSYSYSNNERDKMKYIDYMEENHDNHEYTACISIENIGRGQATKVKIESVECTNETREFFDNMVSNGSVGIFADLVPKEINLLRIQFPPLLRVRKDAKKEEMPFEFIIKIPYKDEFDINEYELTVHITFKIKPFITDLYTGNEQIVIIKPIYYLEMIGTI